MLTAEPSLSPAEKSWPRFLSCSFIGVKTKSGFLLVRRRSKVYVPLKSLKPSFSHSHIGALGQSARCLHQLEIFLFFFLHNYLSNLIKGEAQPLEASEPIHEQVCQYGWGEGYLLRMPVCAGDVLCVETEISRSLLIYTGLSISTH